MSLLYTCFFWIILPFCNWSLFSQVFWNISKNSLQTALLLYKGWGSDCIRFFWLEFCWWLSEELLLQMKTSHSPKPLPPSWQKSNASSPDCFAFPRYHLGCIKPWIMWLNYQPRLVSGKFRGWMQVNILNIECLGLCFLVGWEGNYSGQDSKVSQELAYRLISNKKHGSARNCWYDRWFNDDMEMFVS